MKWVWLAQLLLLTKMRLQTSSLEILQPYGPNMCEARCHRRKHCLVRSFDETQLVCKLDYNTTGVKCNPLGKDDLKVCVHNISSTPKKDIPTYPRKPALRKKLIIKIAVDGRNNLFVLMDKNQYTWLFYITNKMAMLVIKKRIPMMKDLLGLDKQKRIVYYCARKNNKFRLAAVKYTGEIVNIIQLLKKINGFMELKVEDLTLFTCLGETFVRINMKSTQKKFEKLSTDHACGDILVAIEWNNKIVGVPGDPHARGLLLIDGRRQADIFKRLSVSDLVRAR